MLVINKQNDPKIIVIWLHGLGANSKDFISFIEILRMKNIEFILPDAPLIPITINQGLRMPGWYDIISLDSDQHDTKGLKKSMEIVEDVILNRLKKANEKIKICLIGFSQGAALSLFFAAQSLIKIHGVISLSGYIPIKKQEEIDYKIPILALHGLHDDIINIDYAKKSFHNHLKKEDFELRTFNMGHEVILEQVDYIKKFLTSI